MKTPVGLAAGAALFLASLTALADNTEVAADFAIGGWFVSGLGGIATSIGTGVALSPRYEIATTRGWGIASAITATANAVYGSVLIGYAAGPNPCPSPRGGDWSLCLDFRGPFGAIGAANYTVAAVNGVLAGVALSRTSQRPSNVALAPFALDDARGRKVPGVVVMGRF
jgi:hypothetical protein